MSTLRTVVRKCDEGERLDRFIPLHTTLSRRKSRQLITDGAIICNLKVVRVQSRKLGAGDVVDIVVPTDETIDLRLEPLPQVTVLYEDSSILIADKLALVLSQSAEDTDEMAFDEQVLLDLARRNGARPHLRLFHRLDRLTSGAVLFSCNPDIQAPLSRAWANKKVERSYLTVVGIDPDWQEKTIDAPIARDRDHRWRFAVDASGKNAQTRVTVIHRMPSNITLVRCELLTGRTHQVRVHLNHIGATVLGDALYAGHTTEGVKRPLLHAYTICLPHPKTGKMLRVTSTPPDDFSAYLPPEIKNPS